MHSQPGDRMLARRRAFEGLSRRHARNSCCPALTIVAPRATEIFVCATERSKRTFLVQRVCCSRGLRNVLGKYRTCTQYPRRAVKFPMEYVNVAAFGTVGAASCVRTTPTTPKFCKDPVAISSQVGFYGHRDVGPLYLPITTRPCSLVSSKDIGLIHFIKCDLNRAALQRAPSRARMTSPGAQTTAERAHSGCTRCIACILDFGVANVHRLLWNVLQLLLVVELHN